MQNNKIAHLIYIINAPDFLKSFNGLPCIFNTDSNMESITPTTNNANAFPVTINPAVNVACSIKSNMFFKILLHQPFLIFNQKQKSN